jgi:predicted phage tail protein
MPPVIEFILVLGFGFSEAVAGIVAPILFALGSSLVLGEISKLFAKGPSASSLTNQIASRTIVSRH